MAAQGGAAASGESQRQPASQPPPAAFAPSRVMSLMDVWTVMAAARANPFAPVHPQQPFAAFRTPAFNNNALLHAFAAGMAAAHGGGVGVGVGSSGASTVAAAGGTEAATDDAATRTLGGGTPGAPSFLPFAHSMFPAPFMMAAGASPPWFHGQGGAPTWTMAAATGAAAAAAAAARSPASGHSSGSSSSSNGRRRKRTGSSQDGSPGRFGGGVADPAVYKDDTHPPVHKTLRRGQTRNATMFGIDDAAADAEAEILAAADGEYDPGDSVKRALLNAFIAASIRGDCSGSGSSSSLSPSSSPRRQVMAVGGFVFADMVVRAVPGAQGYAAEFRGLLKLLDHFGVVACQSADGDVTRPRYKWLGATAENLAPFLARVNKVLMHAYKDHDRLVEQGLLPPRILLAYASPFSIGIRLFEVFILCRAEELPESLLREFYTTSHRPKVSQTLRWLERAGLFKFTLPKGRTDLGVTATSTKGDERVFRFVHADLLLGPAKAKPEALIIPNHKNKKAVRKCRNLLNFSSFRHAGTWPKYYLDQQRELCDL